MNIKTSKFEWLATESGPKNFPMEIIEGMFFYHQQEEGLYIPSGGTLSEGWGTMISTHIVGEDLKPLPDRLQITFFSYTENSFYQGTFDLPYDKILSMFEIGYFLPEDEKHYTYDRIMCGVAPGGTVVVWLLGLSKITEVFIGHAQKVDLDWQKIMEIPLESREQFVNTEIECFVDQNVWKSIKKNGVPINDWSEKFRARYQWIPNFIVENPPKKLSEIWYVNGEQDCLPFPFDDSFSNISRPIPRQITFLYQNPIGWGYLFIIDFDETEIVESFVKLGGQQELLQLEFKPQYPISNTLIRLRNKDEVITLKKFTIEKLD